ncbi:MAG TPA: phytoene desaturase family protein [Ferruginibacter sp.]|nr:phytoene desaturase family protein [Ferruginibacter sp.]HRO05656.1 phytoene desaturase family protein [Ferruginibacter sp.]HRO95827.1 phytoene desaturase family protein [Ferruginibacter sp.]HRP49164.1 phytoene desaturase family protein [Ferruginibacter sp.]
MARIAVIGAGFSGISAAAYLSAEGHEVHVFEKHDRAGGRARSFQTKEGFLFDMGPSWYWMPDVFEKFFNDFGYAVKDLYDLKKLDPAFDIVYGKEDILSIPDDYNALAAMFESIEPGSANALHAFMEEARYKYETGMEELVYMPGLSIAEYANTRLLKGVFRLQVFSSFSKHVRKYFKHPKLIALMEFPVLFLGAMPADTPALYSLMNYAGLKLGTWYPMGGFSKIIEGMQMIATSLGATFHFNAGVEKIISNANKATGVKVNGTVHTFDGIVAAADYHHVENVLLNSESRNYAESYWDKKVFAPSSLIFYIGLNKKLNRLKHHTLFFDESLDDHAVEIYKNPQWPEKPLFYVCCPSKTDPQVAPEGCENIFVLMPIAAGIHDEATIREQYFDLLMKRLESYVGESVKEHIIYKKSYCVNDFVQDYNAYKGNAYGLANTLWQTALWKPKIRNKHLKNVFYAGQLTVPGPGVPPSLISGNIAARQLDYHLKKFHHESIV